MFGFTLKRIAATWILSMLVLATGAAWSFGYSPATGSINMVDGYGMVFKVLGGIGSILIALLVLVVLVAAISYGTNYLAKKDYSGNDTKRQAHVAIAVVSLFLLAGIAVLIALQLDGLGEKLRGPMLTSVGAFITVSAVTFATLYLFRPRVESEAQSSAVTSPSAA